MIQARWRRRPVFIGPVCCGKTTLLGLVADRLGVEGVDLDEVAGAYYGEVGRGYDALQAKGDAEGFLASYRWWQAAYPHAVRRVLHDHPRALVALGAGHTHYEDAALFDEVRAALRGCYPVLLLPSPDLDRSVEVLRARCLETRGTAWQHEGRDLLAHWVKDRSNHALARQTVYTEGRTPQQTADELAGHFAARLLVRVGA